MHSALFMLFEKGEADVALARRFAEAGWTLWGSAGTAKVFRGREVECRDIEELTGEPPRLGHGLVSLYPRVHARVLTRGTPEDDADLTAHGDQAFTFVRVDPYPVLQKIREGAPLASVLEAIDIGGPAILRGAGKRFTVGRVVIIDPADYGLLDDQFFTTGELAESIRARLAQKVFVFMAEYDAAIAARLAEYCGLTEYFQARLGLGQVLRYGPNPHQKGWFHPDPGSDEPLALQRFTVVQEGKHLSTINVHDIDWAIRGVVGIGRSEPSCVVIKHSNPAGAACRDTIGAAFLSAWEDGDAEAVFGGVVALNRPVDLEMAETILYGITGEKRFLEVVLTPAVTGEALELFAARAKNLRVLVNPALAEPVINSGYELVSVLGGYLRFDRDVHELTAADLHVVTPSNYVLSPDEIDDCLFGWQITKSGISNAVCVVKHETLLGAGVGQMHRGHSCELAVKVAGQS